MAARARRYINPQTRDYEVVAGGLRGDDGFTSKVVLALGTPLESMLAFPEFGSRLHEVKTADERGRKMAEKRAWQALQHLADSVEGLRVQAFIYPKERPGVIEIVVTGRRGTTEMSAKYSAQVAA